MHILAEEAVKSVKGMEENAIHAKYIELVRHHWYARYVFLNPGTLVCRTKTTGTRPCKGETKITQGQGRWCANRRSSLYDRCSFQKAKSQLTKANQTKVKMENLARELQKVSSFTI